MESRPRSDQDDPDDEEPEPPAVTAHESRPGRTVFTESGNADAWIATDLTLEPRR